MQNGIIPVENSYMLVDASQRLKDLQESFINSQDVRASSRNTYRRNITQFFKWIDTNRLSIQELTRADIVRYKENLLSSGMSTLSIGSYLSTVRKFYEYTEANKYYPNIASHVKTPTRKRGFKKQALTEEQAHQLLEYYKNKNTEALRDYAIINLLLRGGLRTIEVIRANIEDIIYKEGERVLIVQGKGRDEKDEFVILTDVAHKPIEEYLTARGQYKAKEPLFTSTSNNNKGGRLTTRAISGIVKDGLKAIGIDNRSITAHSLRHTTACCLRRAGASLEMIQGVLRHKSKTTTEIYLETVADEMRLKQRAEAMLDGVF